MTVEYKDYRIYIKDENHTLMRVKISDGKHRFSKPENVGKELEELLGYYVSMDGCKKRIIKDMVERADITTDGKGYDNYVRSVTQEFENAFTA